MDSDKLNSYKLSRAWFDFSFVNPEKVKPNHAAIYFFAIEHCNRLGWKVNFGFPTTMVMEAVGIKSYNTYINTLNDLVKFGFIKMIEKSKNQYSSNIIALSNFNKAHDKALDKALIKHTTKQSESTIQSIDSIIKQITNKQYNNKQINKLFVFLSDYSKEKKTIIPTYEDFKLHAIKKCKVGNLLFNESKLRLKYDSWVENGWKDGNNKPVKNWKAKLTNTLSYIFEEKPKQTQITEVNEHGVKFTN